MGDKNFNFALNFPKLDVLQLQILHFWTLCGCVQFRLVI